MAGAQEVIMIFRCQDVSLVLCVLMCTFKTLQLTASVLGEIKGEGEEAGSRGKGRTLAIWRGRQAPPPRLFISKQMGVVDDKVLADKLQVK